jgi:hypothetical protein
MTSTRIKYISQTHTHTHTLTTISDKFIDMKKIHLKKGEMLATPFTPTQKTPFISCGKASGYKKITDNCTSEQLVW